MSIVTKLLIGIIVGLLLLMYLGYKYHTLTITEMNTNYVTLSTNLGTVQNNLKNLSSVLDKQSDAIQNFTKISEDRQESLNKTLEEVDKIRQELSKQASVVKQERVAPGAEGAITYLRGSAGGLKRW